MRLISLALLILSLTFLSIFVFQVRSQLKTIKNLHNPPEFDASFVPSSIAKTKTVEIINHLHEYSYINPDEYKPDVEVFSSDRGQAIDLKLENQKTSQWLQALSKSNISSMALIIPGYISELEDPEVLSETAKLRIKLGMIHFRKGLYSVVILTGGNVHPRSTPYNEAKEMKRYILEKYKLPEHYIFIEPHAENSVMNLSLSAKIMSVHNISKAHIITTPVHNFYFGHPYLSGFHLRSILLLGKLTGKIKFIDRCVSEFVLESN